MISKGVTNYTSTMSSSNYHVIFDEALSYYDLASSGMLLPITDIVRATGTDGKTIESKLSDRQRQALTALDGEYYALPHYEFYGGVVYDIDVFESKKLYFSNNPDVNGGFIVSDDDTRSAGPDGQPKTSDDGLPADYEQFFALCDYMVRKGVTPFIWTGKVNDYLNYLLQALFLSYCGAEEALYNVTFDSGEGTTEIVSRFENGQPVTERVGITPQTGYLLSRQAGKYYALSFLKTILSDSDYYYRDQPFGKFIPRRCAGGVFLRIFGKRAHRHVDRRQLLVQRGGNFGCCGARGQRLWRARRKPPFRLDAVTGAQRSNKAYAGRSGRLIRCNQRQYCR